MPAIDKKRPSPLLRDLTRWTLNDQGVTEVQKVVVGKFAAAILSTRHRLTVLGDHRWTIPPEKLSTCVPARLCPAGQELCAVSSLSGATLCSVLGGDGAAIPVALLRERLQSSLNGAGLKLQEIFKGSRPAAGSLEPEELPSVTLKVMRPGEFKDVGVGRYHMAAVPLNDDVLVSGGRNHEGQCQPPDLVQEVGASAVSCGMKHTAVLLLDGRVVIFGKGERGQTTVPAGFSTFLQVLAFDRVTLGLSADGRSLVRMGEVHGPGVLWFWPPVREVILADQEEWMRDDEGWFHMLCTAQGRSEGKVWRVRSVKAEDAQEDAVAPPHGEVGRVRSAQAEADGSLRSRHRPRSKSC